MKRNRYVICPSCDAMNASFSETCDQCGARLSPATAVDTTVPKEPVARRTHFQRPTTIRLIGIWSIALPNVVAGVWCSVGVLQCLNRTVGINVLWGQSWVTLRAV